MMMMIMLMGITAMLFDSFETKSIKQTNLVISAVGDNVILHCFRGQKENTDSIIWYKQKVGHQPCVMVSVQSNPAFEDEFKSPKFSIEKEEKGCHLKIADVEPSDEAMYYCGYIQFITRFTNGTFLSVKGKPDFSVSVRQESVSDSVPAGASVTLQCSVLSESRAAELQVLWFRAAPSQSHPQLIYTHHNSSLQCESESSTHTCVYNLTKNIFSLNDTGTYYCAVVLCGKIIFGNGTRVQLERPVDPVMICLAVALGVCVFMIFAQAVWCKWKNCGQRSVKLKQASVTHKSLSQDCEIVEVNYAALHFNERRVKRGRVKKQQPQNVIYSDVQRLSVN
ncbi:uncharacterized protein LOC124385737 [Silurus meridionalis]|uniref:uncharacterized protein LOC124385737 n=1 Tax=Silurus meridionalis TaxID=175797 RepID=UPI001EECF1B9|nr:uncharacterized protein LOC124385737 [Silurus meridionalis]